MKLKRHGADLIGLCPFHEDHSPSLVISPQKNLWNCLGACGKGGSVIDWVMRAEGMSFRHAVELLRHEHLPLAASPGAKLPQRSTVPKLPAPVSREADDRALLLQVARYYHETLKQTPEALKYLSRRGLTSSEMIEHFQLGFANRTLGYGLPQKNRVAGAEMRGRLQKLGILRESGHEHFNGSVVIPIFDRQGEVVQMYGRKITRETALRDGTPVHLYLPGPHRGVWNEEALAASKEIILCEALIDALTFWCAGYPPRDGELRRERLHRRSPGRVQKVRHAENLDRLRPRRRRREEQRQQLRRRTDGDGHRVFPGAVPEEHGRERIRAQGDACSEESRRAVEQSRSGSAKASGPHVARDRAASHRRKIRSQQLKKKSPKTTPAANKEAAKNLIFL